MWLHWRGRLTEHAMKQNSSDFALSQEKCKNGTSERCSWFVESKALKRDAAVRGHSGEGWLCPNSHHCYNYSNLHVFPVCRHTFRTLQYPPRGLLSVFFLLYCPPLSFSLATPSVASGSHAEVYRCLSSLNRSCTIPMICCTMALNLVCRALWRGLCV